jgi:hypothetical protein
LRGCANNFEIQNDGCQHRREEQQSSGANFHRSLPFSNFSSLHGTRRTVGINQATLSPFKN